MGIIKNKRELQILKKSENGLVGELSYVFGEKYDTKKHQIGAKNKAVTYHMVQVNETDPIFVQVLFDI